MDIEELKSKLKPFVNNCSDKGYIYNELTFDEAYPDIRPTSFIVNLVAKKSWKYPTIGQALDTLIDTLRVTTETETRRNIFTLSLYTIDEMVNSERMRDKEQIAINPDLNSEQINKLYHDKKKSVRDKIIIAHIETSKLTKKEMYSIFDTNDDVNIDLLKKRFRSDKGFEERVLADKNLKFKILQYGI